MHIHEAFPLLLFALGAFLIPLLAGRIGVPAAVGEIIYGIAVGPQVLALAHDTSFTTVLAELGFAFLMFLVGLELDFSRIEREGARPILWGIATAVLVFAISFALTTAVQLPTFMFLVFGAMSVGILLVTLAEAGLHRSTVGQGTIFVGSVGEALTIVLLTALGYYYQLGLTTRLLIELGKLFAIFGAAYLLLVLLRTLIWWWPDSFARVVQEHDPTEVGVRAGLALMLAFVAFAALMGVEAILGAFVAGALVSFVFRDKEVLLGKFSSIGFGFFVPLFFIWVGIGFDLSAVWSVETWRQVGLFALLSLAAKMLPSLLLRLRGFTLRQSMGAGLLLAAPLTLLVAIGQIGKDLKIIDQATESAIVLLAVVTSLVLPWLFRAVMKSSLPEPQPANAAQTNQRAKRPTGERIKTTGR